MFTLACEQVLHFWVRKCQPSVTSEKTNELCKTSRAFILELWYHSNVLKDLPTLCLLFFLKVECPPNFFNI